MTQIEQIKAEIERLKRDNGKDGRPSNITEMLCSHLLSFIELMEKEQEVNLDEEIDNYFYPPGFKRDLDGVHIQGVCMRDWKGENKKWIEKRLTANEIRDFARHFYELGCRKKDNAPKIKGWVARDKDGQGFVFRSMPFRSSNGKGWVGFYHVVLQQDDFPEVTWEDEPIEVEFEIHKVK